MNPRIAEVTERMEARRVEIELEMKDQIFKKTREMSQFDPNQVTLVFYMKEIAALKVGIEELFRLMGEKEQEALNQEKPNENAPWRK